MHCHLLFRRAFLGITTVLFSATAVFADLLPNNFWPNPDFEEGTELTDPVAGTLSGWSRGGSDPTICRISTKAYSGSYSLSVVDEGNSYGEFYSDVSLAGRATAGDTLDLRWQEVYQIQSGEMRVTVLFLDSSGGTRGVKHFVRTGASAGFGGSLEEAEWVQRDESAEVPEGAATLRISLVSGGAETVKGVYAVDELSVARHPAPILLANNLWTNNPTFEEGDNLDTPAGVLTHWNRGGSGPEICQVTTDNYISPGHSLALVDQDTHYGEWYSDLPLAGVAAPGDTLNLQWFELFQISAGGEMRLSVLALGGGGEVVDVRHFVAKGQSAGWNGTDSGSTFVKRNETYQLPAGAATLRISVVSGGSEATTGIFVVDDISINKSTPPLPEVLAGNVWPNPGFEEGTGLETQAGTPAGWSRGGNLPSLCVVTTDNAVSPTHALAVSDDSDTGFGEWYSSFPLGAATAGGRLLNLQWFELYQVTSGEMRFSLLFFDANNQILSQSHFVARGNSTGWKSSVADSTFTRRNESVAVPLGAVRMQASLVSGGPESSKGVLVIDNFSLAPAPTDPVVLFGNLASNPGFEEGPDLDNPRVGKPSGWERGGADVSIDQVLTGVFQSSTHALAVVDDSTTSYGEWYRNFDLGNALHPGDLVALQWWELYSVSAGGEMRLSLLFFNAGGAVIGQQNFVAKGNSSGWGGTLPVSFFTKRNETITLPPDTTRFLITLTSGGPADTTGILVIDDLSFAPPTAPPDLLTGNFWSNSTFEDGIQLNNPTAGVPTGWSRGGSYIPGDRVNNGLGTSPTHSLELNDDKEDAYSEWYQFWNFGDRVHGGDVVEIQWFWVYDTTGDMRLSFVWFGADGANVGENNYIVHGQSAEFTGEVDTSPFVKEFRSIRIPDKAVRGLVSFASGGALSVKGRIILDDLSLRVVPFRIVDTLPGPGGWLVSWESTPDRVYQLQSSDTLSPADFQPVPGAESIAGDPAGEITEFTDTRPNATTRFYRVIVVPATAAQQGN